MPFRDPIVAGTTLIRPAIQSPNFVHGVSGWTINRDGSAEFNNVIVRGTVIASDFQSTNYVANTTGFDINGITGLVQFNGSVVVGGNADLRVQASGAPTPTVTITNITAANPAVFTTSAAHNLFLGEEILLQTLVGGAGFTVNTPYYVVALTSNTFRLSTTLGGTAIAATTVGSGTYRILGGYVELFPAAWAISSPTINLGPQQGETGPGQLVAEAIFGFNAYQIELSAPTGVDNSLASGGFLIVNSGDKNNGLYPGAQFQCQGPAVSGSIVGQVQVSSNMQLLALATGTTPLQAPLRLGSLSSTNLICHPAGLDAASSNTLNQILFLNNNSTQGIASFNMRTQGARNTGSATITAIAPTNTLDAPITMTLPPSGTLLISHMVTVVYPGNSKEFFQDFYINNNRTATQVYGPSVNNGIAFNAGVATPTIRLSATSVAASALGNPGDSITIGLAQWWSAAATGTAQQAWLSVTPSL